MLPGITVVPGESLRQVAAWLRGEPLAREPFRPARPAVHLGRPGTSTRAWPGWASLPWCGRLLEVSAAGGHHLCLTGPRGADVPALAAGLVTLLPDLTGQEAAEVAAIYSAAGLLGARACPDHAAAAARP